MKANQSKKVLIVDDFPAMRNSVREMMIKRGFSTLEACNGIEALKILNDEKIDLIISDLVMPEMDGFDLCDRIKSTKDLCHLPVIILSTQRDVRFIMKAMKLGADDYLIKPLESDLLEKVLNRVFLSEEK